MKFWEALISKITPNRLNEEDHQGRQAQVQARSQFIEAKQRSAEVDRVTQSLRDLRERNHFGDAVEAAMLRRRPS